MDNHGHLYVADNYSDIYHNMLRDVMISPNHEVIGMSYVLKSPINRNVINSVRAFDVVNAEKFFQWTLSGETDLTPLKLVTKRAQMYDREVDGRNPHYGPRINLQLDNMIDELAENLNTRRGCVLILDAKDQIFLPTKRDEHNTIEYPCTISLTYFIRSGRLHAHTVMRSNNMCSTIVYDNWNFTRLQEVVLEKINQKFVFPIRLGFYFHYIINAHIIRGEVKRTNKILIKHFGKNWMKGDSNDK